MIVKHVNALDLALALERVNEVYGNNVDFRRLENISSSRTKRWRVTLKVKSSKGPGHSLGSYSDNGHRRRLAAACWHVHGCFFDALPSEAEIEVTLHGKQTIKPGDDWEDYEVGSIAYPAMASKMCECPGRN